MIATCRVLSPLSCSQPQRAALPSEPQRQGFEGDGSSTEVLGFLLDTWETRLSWRMLAFAESVLASRGPSS